MTHVSTTMPDDSSVWESNTPAMRPLNIHFFPLSIFSFVWRIKDPSGTHRARNHQVREDEGQVTGTIWCVREDEGQVTGTMWCVREDEGQGTGTIWCVREDEVQGAHHPSGVREDEGWRWVTN